MVISNEAKWFVSFEALGGRRRALRETKIFPNEEEARLYAEESVLADRKNIMAGTFLSPWSGKTRRLISGRELYSWSMTIHSHQSPSGCPWACFRPAEQHSAVPKEFTFKSYVTQPVFSKEHPPWTSWVTASPRRSFEAQDWSTSKPSSTGVRHRRILVLWKWAAADGRPSAAPKSIILVNSKLRVRIAAVWPRLWLLQSRRRHPLVDIRGGLSAGALRG